MLHRKMTAVRGLTALLVALAWLPLASAADRPDGPQPISPADWPMYNHDVGGWRFNPAEKTLSPANVGKLVEKWRFPAADSKETIGVVHATPAVVAGEVYFGTATFPAFYKLAPDGTLRWVYRNPVRKAVLPPTDGTPITEKLRGAASDGGIFSSALVADGAVYFADTAGWMYCLDAETGKERWKVDTRAKTFPDAHFNNLLMASPILADGKVVFGGGTLEQLFAGTKAYPGSTGRGFVVALEPKTGKIVWKYDVGPKPAKLDPPVIVKDSWGEHKWDHGPATSSVWCTPSYDPETNTLFFGTDVNTAPRQPTKENPALHTEDSCAIACIDAATGKRKWNTQINPGDHVHQRDARLRPQDRALQGLFDRRHAEDLQHGCGRQAHESRRCRVQERRLLHLAGRQRQAREAHAAVHRPADGTAGEARPARAGAAQSHRRVADRLRHRRPNHLHQRHRRGAAGHAGSAPPLAGQMPTGGRVTATSVDLATERWRHERPKIAAMGGTPEKPMYTNVGDIVASGIAVGNGVAYFTAVGSGKLIALDAAYRKGVEGDRPRPRVVRAFPVARPGVRRRRQHAV